MKKRDKKFETLEDIEQQLLKPSGVRKEKKERIRKTAYAQEFSLEYILQEYGRLLVIPAICVVLIVIILIGEAIADRGGSGDGQGLATASVAETSSAGTETSGEEGSGETETEPETDPNKLKACEDPGIDTAVNEYFTARLHSDTDTLYRLFGRTEDTGKEQLAQKLQAQASWIQSFDGIRVYTMPGLEEDERVCIIRYKINFRRTNTNAAGIMYCYMTRRSDGSWQILENPDSQRVKYLNEKLQDPDVIAMQDEVDSELRSALASDSDLALIYTSFLNGEIYNETAPDVNREQEVDLFLNPEDSDLVGDMVFEIDSESDEAAGAENITETETATDSPAEPAADTAPETEAVEVPEGQTEAPAPEITVQVG